MFVGTGIIVFPIERQEFWQPQVVAFRVYDTMQPDSARGDYTGHMTGLVRPLLPWITTCSGAEPAPHACAVPSVAP
jgi:hypothetical protein